MTVIAANLAVDKARRNIIAITCAAGGAGAAAIAVPFVGSLAPSERAKAAGAPVEVDVAGLKPGEKMTVEWRGKPVWIVYRSDAMLQNLAKVVAHLADPWSERTAYPLPKAIKGKADRAIKDKYLVVLGVCTHLGCSPNDRLLSGPQPSLPDDWQGGFLCPCHGSMFDLAGRVYKNMPAPDNLEVPPHHYVSETRIVIGEDGPGT